MSILKLSHGGFFLLFWVEGGGVKKEMEWCLRNNCITEAASFSCQSATPRQEVLQPSHSVLNEELIIWLIFKGRGEGEKVHNYSNFQ